MYVQKALYSWSHTPDHSKKHIKEKKLAKGVHLMSLIPSFTELLNQTLLYIHQGNLWRIASHAKLHIVYTTILLLKNYFLCTLEFCLHVCPLELELQTIVSSHVGTGK